MYLLISNTSGFGELDRIVQRLTVDEQPCELLCRQLRGQSKQFLRISALCVVKRHSLSPTRSCSRFSAAAAWR